MKILGTKLCWGQLNSTVIRGQYIALNAYIREEENLKVNTLSTYPNLEKEEKNKLKERIIKQTIKIVAEMVK